MELKVKLDHFRQSERKREVSARAIIWIPWNSHRGFIKPAAALSAEGSQRGNGAAVWAQSTTCLSPSLPPPTSTRLLDARLWGTGRVSSEFSKAVSTKLSYKTNAFVLTPFSAKLQLAVLMPHFLPMWSLFKADVIDFIPYNWPWDAALAWRDMSVASRLFFNLSTGSLHPTPTHTHPPVQKHSGMRARTMQMKRQFNRVLLILVRTWMILIITRSLSLIGPFSKSTFARATLIDHSVDMLQAYIGIKYLRAELWWCLSCQGGWGGGGYAMPSQKEAVVFIWQAWKCMAVSLWQHNNRIFSPRWVSKCNIKFTEVS